MDDQRIDTWRAVQDHTARAQSGVDWRQHEAYLKVLDDTMHAQQPGAALRYDRAGNRAIATKSCAVHAAHCAGSVWHACQENMYPKHYDPMSQHYHVHQNSATPEV